MKKFYSEPEAEIRKYSFTEDICTNPSDPDTTGDLHNQDEYEYFDQP